MLLQLPLLWKSLAMVALLRPISDDLPPKVEIYLQNYRYLAYELNQQTQIPVAIILGVAGLESDWGTSELAVQSNNHFGIKSKNWQGPVYCKITQEYEEGKIIHPEECFRKYLLIRDSYHDFGKFLLDRPHYSQILDLAPNDYQTWASALGYYNYGTDPDYREKLLSIIQKYGLDKR